MAFSAVMIVLLFIGIAVLLLTRPKDDSKEIYSIGSNGVNSRLQSLEESQIEVNSRLGRIETMLNKLIIKKLG